MTGTSIARTAAAGLVFLALSTAGAVAAQAPEPVRGSGPGLEERIDMMLKDAAAADVLASFGHISGTGVVIDPEIRGKVSIELHHVRAATALTAVCESLGCLWRLEGGELRIEKDPGAPQRPEPAAGRAEGPSAARLDEPIDLELVDADLRQTLQAFATIVEARAAIAASLEGTVTVQLANTPVRKALDAICRVQGCNWELVESPEGPVLRFAPAR